MDQDSEITVEHLKKVVRQFVDDREWESFHTPKNLSMSIAIESAELMELFQWQSYENKSCIDKILKEKAADELADILIYCFSFANAASIDVAQAVLTKLKVNEKRFPASGDKNNKGKNP